MENLSILKSAIVVIVLMYLLLPGPSTAYNQVKTHPEINDVAYERFVRDWMPNDASLSNCSMDKNKVLSGPAWDQDMGNSRLGEIPNQIRTKNVKNWLKSGGHSADMPEIPKGLRHYCAPNAKYPYITDLKAEFDVLNGFKAACLGGTAAATAYSGPVGGLAVTGFCSVIYGGLKFIVNWQGASEDINTVLKNGVLGISNIDWAFDSSNPYSFSKAKEYYKNALGLTDSSADSQYSKAWRSVGETMHLISDLTVPAHTRNDGHGIQEEPYENFAKVSNVLKYSDPVLFTYSSDLDYRRKAPGKDLKTFMKEVATWTSEHFLSRDTIPIEGKDITANGQPAFSSPKLDEYKTLTEDGKTYYYNYISTTNGLGESHRDKTELATKTPWSLLVWKNADPELDNRVLAAQASILIPTAIEASCAVQDAFLPRFVAKIDDVSKNPADETQYIVKGSLEHIPTVEWPEKLEVRNGASIKITKKDGTEGSAGVHYPGDGAAWTWTGKLEKDDVIVLEFNLGGYVVSSQPYTINVSPCLKPKDENSDPNGWMLYGNCMESKGDLWNATVGYWNAVAILSDGPTNSEYIAATEALDAVERRIAEQEDQRPKDSGASNGESSGQGSGASMAGDLG
jgi:hypothetical protein